MISGDTWACALRPTTIPRCRKQTPTSPKYSMICPFPGGIASMNGLTKGSRAAVVVDLYQEFFARYV